MMNEIVKGRDDMLEAIRADHEILKGKLFEMLDEAIMEKYRAGLTDNYPRNLVAMERWTVLKQIVDDAGITGEFKAYRRAKKEATK